MSIMKLLLSSEVEKVASETENRDNVYKTLQLNVGIIPYPRDSRRRAPTAESHYGK